MTPSPPAHTSRRALGALMATAFIDNLGMYLVVALLPFLARDLGARPTEIGVLVALYALAQVLTAPLWGAWSDRRGRRPVILLGLLITCVGFVFLALGESLLALYVARTIQGVGGGTVGVIFAFIHDQTTEERRAQTIGWVTSVTSAAAMIGPVVGSLASRLGSGGPGTAAALLTALALVVAWLWLPEPPSVEGSAKETDASANTASQQARRVLGVTARPMVAHHRLIWIYAAGMLAFAALTGVIGLVLAERFEIGADQIWQFFAVLGGASIVFRVFVLGPAIRRIGEPRLVPLGAVCFGAGLAAVGVAPHLWLLWIVLLLVPLGTALLFPATTSLISSFAERAGEPVGAVLGVQQSYGGCAKIVGPIAAGALLETAGVTTPFLVLALLLLLASWLGAMPLEKRSS